MSIFSTATSAYNLENGFDAEGEACAVDLKEAIFFETLRAQRRISYATFLSLQKVNTVRRKVVIGRKVRTVLAVAESFVERPKLRSRAVANHL